MAELGIYKLDNGRSYPSNCFPIRSFFLPRNEGAGHWLVAHRNALEEEISKRKNISDLEVHFGKEGKGVQASNTLEAQLLITLHCVDKPSDLCSVNISGQRLETVKLEGLEQFDNIAYINASDNHLTLEPFGRFPALRELELSLNSLHKLEIHADDFKKLEVLDLSFNNVTGESILNLGLLPCLKVLHLTGNQLQMLPLSMAGSCNQLEENTDQGVSLFESLEVLMLDDNNLTSPGVFMSLANMKRLRHLNLQGNLISEVPFLEQMATLEDAQAGNIPQSILQNPSLINDKRRTYSEIKMIHKTIEKTLEEDKACLQMHLDHLKYLVQRKKDCSSLDQCLPFPELHYLNLANNEIAEEEALLPVVLFPKLSELVIHSNPLTTQKSGDPPMLTSFLQDKLGIKITRKKTTDHVKQHICPKRKVKTTTSITPKLASIMASPHATKRVYSKKYTSEDCLLPSEYGLMHVFDLPSQISIKDEKDISIGQEHFDFTRAGLSFEMIQNEESFFVTEVNELNESDYQKDSYDAEETKLKVKKCSKACPEKLIGYEILLGDTSGPEMPETCGIQHAVNVLEHTLKNLLVYRDSKANVDIPQKLYIERERKIKNLPPLEPKKSRGKIVDGLLDQIKETKTISKYPLDNILKGGNKVDKSEYNEALILLKDLKRKYSTPI